MDHHPAAFLFDLDGLLLNTEPIHGQAWTVAARHYGLELSEVQVLSLRGRRRQDCAEQVDRWLAKPVGADALLAIQQPYAKAHLPKAPAMPGAETLVRYGHDNGLPMAIVTSSSAEAVSFKSRPHPWLNLIQTRVYGDDPALVRGKPHPDPFVLGAQKLGCATSECWAFEDSTAGRTSALAAGCLVWVLDSTKPEQLNGNPRTIKTLQRAIDDLVNTSD